MHTGFAAREIIQSVDVDSDGVERLRLAGERIASAWSRFPVCERSRSRH